MLIAPVQLSCAAGPIAALATAAAIRPTTMPMGTPIRAPLILVHGAGMDGRVWRGFLRLLALEHWPAIAPDLPGHGASSGSAPTDPAALAATILDIAAAADSTLPGVAAAGAPVVVGHSMGGIAAFEAVRASPTAFRGLGVVGLGARMPVNPDLLALAAAAPDKAATRIASWAFASERGAAGLATGFWPRLAARRLICAALPGVLAGDLALCDRWAGIGDAGTALPAAFPVLVAVGAGDRMTPPEAAGALAAALPGSRFHSIVGAGHMPMIEAPRRLQACLVNTFR